MSPAAYFYRPRKATFFNRRFYRIFTALPTFASPRIDFGEKKLELRGPYRISVDNCKGIRLCMLWWWCRLEFGDLD